ncbi:MAG: sel1 repeat family protein [Gammaproteobacteria bacterium]|nr:sel1 repeat family protein [Gammaproteobacteria bacterium]
MLNSGINRFRLIPLFIIAALPGYCSYQGSESQLELASIATTAGNYDAAFSRLRQLATAGELEAQFRLGDLYATESLPQYSPQESLKWLQLAAEGGHAEAQYHLALTLLPKKGENNSAIRWLTRAADQGVIAAKEQLKRLTRSQGDNALPAE